MLNVKKLLTKILNCMGSVKTATLASGVSGEVKYVHIGKVCALSGYLNTTDALTNGQTLVTGLPNYYSGYSNAAITAVNNNSASENVILLMATSDIRVRGSYSAANRSLRFSFAYLTSTVGGGGTV